jgi:hypothetical protein
VEAGRSPLGPIWIPAKTVRVRALRDDPRRFDAASDEAQARLQPGVVTHVFLDLRPSVMLRSVPEPARVYRVTGAARDSLLGETPISLRSAFLEGNRLRLEARDHADSVLEGGSLLALDQSGARVAVSLRRIAETLPSAPRKTPLLRKRWLQWSLVGIGAALTGAAAVFRRDGDRWYNRYLESSDRRVLDAYFDRAVRYDHLSLVSLGVGQAFFTGGLVLLVNGSGPR